MSLHKENSFETEICQHLAEHGWLYAEHPQGVRRGCKDAKASTTTQHPQGVRRGCKDAAPRDTPSDKASTTTQHDAAGYDRALLPVDAQATQPKV